MAAMNTRTTFPFVVIPVDSSEGGPEGVLAGGPVGQPGAGSMVSLQAPHQPAGSKPGTQTPPANVLQVVKQVSSILCTFENIEIGTILDSLIIITRNHQIP